MWNSYIEFRNSSVFLFISFYYIRNYSVLGMIHLVMSYPHIKLYQRRSILHLGNEEQNLVVLQEKCPSTKLFINCWKKATGEHERQRY